MQLVQLSNRLQELSGKRSESAVVSERVVIELEDVYILLTVKRQREGRGLDVAELLLKQPHSQLHASMLRLANGRLLLGSLA